MSRMVREEAAMPEQGREKERTLAGGVGVWEALVGHRFYRYRGCAPAPAEVADFPGQALGDAALHVDAWHGRDRGEDDLEPQRERIARERAAQAVCARCPVLEACRAYATAEDDEGRLREPQGIWGGMLALDRHRELIKRRAAAGPAPVVVSADRLAEARTPQKQALLGALAREVDEELVAWRAGLDLRTANWQRSLLCGLLGLDKETATRGELLETARRLGVLPRGVRVRPDGRWPVAAAPTTDGVRQRRIAPGAPVQLVLPVLGLLAPAPSAAGAGSASEAGLGGGGEDSSHGDQAGATTAAGSTAGSAAGVRSGTAPRRASRRPSTTVAGRGRRTAGTLRGRRRARGPGRGLRVVRPPTAPTQLDLFQALTDPVGASSSARTVLEVAA